jgi:hypothetical protein
MGDRRQLSLNLFIYPGGHHEAAWRYKGSAAGRVLDISYYQELAARGSAQVRCDLLRRRTGAGRQCPLCTTIPA